MGRLLIDTIPFTMTKRQINESLEDNNGRLMLMVSYNVLKLKTKMVEFIHVQS
jgi:hypothetical protein